MINTLIPSLTDINIDIETIKNVWMPRLFMFSFVFALIAAVLFVIRTRRYEGDAQRVIQNKAMALTCVVMAVFSLFMMKFYAGPKTDNGGNSVIPEVNSDPPVVIGQQDHKYDVFEFQTYIFKSSLFSDYGLGSDSIHDFFSWWALDSKALFRIGKDGAAEIAEQAVNGTAEAKAAWEETKTEFFSIYERIVSEAEEKSDGSFGIVFIAVDEDDPTHYLYAIDDGEVIFDLAEENAFLESAERKEEVLELAEEYLRLFPYSYKELVRQLEYDGYLENEAVYAVENCGADWYEQAARAAKNALEYKSYEEDELLKYLQNRDYTYEQAVYGIEHAGD